jgi:signal transduction histidine kinase
LEELEAAQAELAAAERREGVLEERQRLSREIHDTLAQGFTSIVMHLEAAEAALPDDPDTTHKHLDRARSTARHSLEQARRVVQDLRPQLLEHSSLQEAINRAADRWSESSGIPVEVTITGEPWPLHQEIEVTLLRATQEGLNNISKHAVARQVRLTLSYMADMIILDMQDDGQGIVAGPQDPQLGGFGLQGMRERVEGLGGEVALESEPGEGTTLAVMIPCSSGKLIAEDK